MMKFGRLPRTFDPRIPHLSALLSGKSMPTLPDAVDYTQGMPASLGEMLNDTLGDCTIAGVYHAIQVWTNAANPPMLTEPDSIVEQLYEQACGYVPGDPSTDQGGVEQDVLKYLVRTGAPMASGVPLKMSLFVEIDVRNLNDIRYGIYDCGIDYFGIQVPAYLMQSVPPVWDVNPSGDQSIVGDHCIIAAGYLANGNLKIISWGTVYEMTPAFFAANCQEAYAIASPDWIAATGRDPLGQTSSQQETLMRAIRETSW